MIIFTNILNKNMFKLPHKLNIKINVPTHQTLGECVKELIEASYKIYTHLVQDGCNTIVCGGQSPAYYCLAMMNMKIYNPTLLNIVILPHSKSGQKTVNSYLQKKENELYSRGLKAKNIIIKGNIAIIDGVHSGTGILALESALKYCYGPQITSVKKIALNAEKGIARIEVDEEIVLHAEPIFSDVFKRLIPAYYYRDFGDVSKFITEFNLGDNPLADMIIDLASKYPEQKVEDSEWFKLNNDVTPQIEAQRAHLQQLHLYYINRCNFIVDDDPTNPNFTPIVVFNDENEKNYICPACNSRSGTWAVKFPTNLSYFSHEKYCPYKNKIPIEAEPEP